jgi:hypothetical protein
MRDAAGELDHLEPALDVALGVGHDLAVLARQQFGELVHVRFDQRLNSNITRARRCGLVRTRSRHLRNYGSRASAGSPGVGICGPYGLKLEPSKCRAVRSDRDPLAPSRHAHDQRDNEQDEEEEEQNLRNASRSRRDAAEAENSRDDRDNEENKSPTEHGTRPPD